MKINKYLDKLIISIFLIIIFIPNIGLFQKTNADKIRVKLNREPYQLPDLNLKSLGLTNFSGIEKWYVDKMLFVVELNKLWSNFNYRLGVSIKPGKSIIGKNKWLFLGNDYNMGISQYTGENIPTTDEMMQMIISFRQINDIATQAKVPFLIIVAPDKHEVYPENLPDYITKGSHKSRLDILDELLPANGINFIDLRKTETEAKNTLGKTYGDLYLAGDSHWNYVGAYAAYNAIAEYALKNFQIKLNNNKITFKPCSTTATDLSNFLQVTDLVSNSPTPNIDKLNIVMQGKDDRGDAREISPFLDYHSLLVNGPFQYINTTSKNKSSILLIGDSFSHALGFYFYNDFKNTIEIGNANYNYNFPDLIEKYKPKLIVFEIVERSLLNYSNNFKPYLVHRSISNNNISPTLSTATFDFLTLEGGNISVTGWGYIPNQNAANSKVYLRLNGKKYHYDFLLNQAIRPDVAKAFTNGSNLALSGFFGRIKQTDISRDVYKPSIIIINGKISSEKKFNESYSF